MKFIETPIQGAFVLELEPRGDDRGFFARAFCKKELAEHGVDFDIAQINLANTKQAGTLRGFHYQVPPSKEAKFFRCIKGSIFDAIVDVRPDSPTFGKCFGAVLSAENHHAMVVPANCAHAYLTLEDDTTAYYAAADFYNPPLELGLRYNDPIVQVDWPTPPVHLSEKDKAWPDFKPEGQSS